MLANGMGKSRARQDGSSRTAKTWRTLILSTGEKGIAEKIAEDGGKIQAGQLVRIVDISADAGASLGIFEDIHSHPNAKAFSESLKSASSRNYGQLAPLFIQKLIDNPQSKQDVCDFLKQSTLLLCPENVDGQIQRVAKRFMLAVCAGEMAIKWQLLPWQEGEALKGIRKCFDDWLTQRGSTEAHENIIIYEQVMLFMEQHGKTRFQDLSNLDTPCFQRVGFRRRLAKTTEYFILPQSFKAELCKGLNYERVVNVLSSRGLLQKGDGRNFTKKSPVPLGEFGRTRCYILCIHEGENDI